MIALSSIAKSSAYPKIRLRIRSIVKSNPGASLGARSAKLFLSSPLALLALLCTGCCGLEPMLCYQPSGDALEAGRDTEIFFHDLDPLYQGGEAIGAQLDLDLSELEDRLDLRADPGLQVVFTRDFADEPRAISARFARHVDGIYNRERHLVMLEWQRGRDQLRATMRHELAHALIASRYRNLPEWLNEGIATCCEPSKGSMKWERLLRFAARLHERGPIPAAEVMSRPVRAYGDYNDAWALCYSLLSLSGYEAVDLVDAVARETLPRDLAEDVFARFQDSLGEDLEDLLVATGGIDALLPGEAGEILRFLQRGESLLVPFSDPQTILALHRKTESEGRRYRGYTSSILRVAIAPKLEPELLARIPALRTALSQVDEREAFAYVREAIALERWFQSELGDLLPAALILRLDLRPMAVRGTLARASFWLRRRGALSREQGRTILRIDEQELSRRQANPDEGLPLERLVLRQTGR